MSESEKKPFSKKLGAKALSGLLSRHLQVVAKDWSAALGAAVSFGTPSVSEVPAAGLGKMLSWPLALVPVSLDGEFHGRFAVLMTPEDAGTLSGHPVATPPALSPELIEGVQKLFAPFCASAKAYAKAGTVEASQEAVRFVEDAEHLPESQVAADGWLAEVKTALGGGKAVQLWTLFPLDLGTALAEAHHAPPGAPSAAPKGQKGTILVVDDQYSIRTLIRRHLEKEGFAIVECSNGEEAIQRLAKKEKPVAMISDVMMPGMDGFELCRRLRQMPDGKQLPVIMCTGKGQRRDVVEALEAGANDYIVKPFTREILLAKLAKVMAPPAPTPA